MNSLVPISVGKLIQPWCPTLPSRTASHAVAVEFQQDVGKLSLQPVANVTVVPEPKGYQKRSCQLGITVEPLQVFDLVSV